MEKVIVIINDKMGGVPNVFINVLKYMTTGGLEFSFLLLHQVEDRQQGIYDFLTSRGMRAKKIVYSKFDNKHYLYKKIARHIKGNYTLIANDYRELESYYDNGLTNPLIYVVHGDEPAEYQKMVRFSAIIDKFIGVSQFITDRLKEELPSREEDIIYISQPIPDYEGQKVRVESTGPLRLIYIGRYTRLKGQEELIAVAGSLQTAGIDVHWTFISNGVKENEFRSRFPQGVEARFFSNISNEQVYELLLENDLFVFPSHREGFPLVVVEAMKCGVVPVVSDLETAIPEIVHEGVTGFRVPIGDVAGYLEKVKMLNEDRDMLKRISVSAMEEVGEKFDPRQRAADYLSVIYSIAGLLPKKKIDQTISTSMTGLDRRFFPNYLVKKIRKFRSRNKT